MKAIFGLAIAAAMGMAHAELQDAHCLVVTAGQLMGCNKYPVNKDDITDCGTEGKQPCPTNGGFCGKCYRIDYERDDLHDSVKCNGGVCPGYQSSIVVKTTGMTGTPDVFGVTQQGWRKLCPYICQGGAPVCVESPDQCVSGSPAEKEVMGADGQLWKFPSSCDAGEKRVKITELEKCPDDMVGAPAKEQRAAGEIGTPDVVYATQCNIVMPGHLSSCGTDPTYEATEDLVNKCGKTDTQPCFASGKPEECGKCFKLTYRDPGQNDGWDCVNQTCTPWVGEAYVKVVEDAPRGVDFGIAQGAIEALCPHVCTGQKETCVKDPKECAAPIPGMVIDDYSYPSGCHKSQYLVTKEEIECKFTTQPLIAQPK